MEQKEYYQNLLKRFCKAHHISSRKLQFENIEYIVVIHIKNHLKEEVDLTCFKIQNLVYQTVGPLDIKFNQQLCLYPNGERLDRVLIHFNKDDYMFYNWKQEM